MTTRILSLTCVVVLFAASAINADDTAPVPAPTRVPDIIAVTPLPSPPVPQPQPRPRPVTARHAERQLSKVEHLRLAADHLEAAGADEVAREIRAEAEALLAHSVERLDELRGQVAELQREIAELEATTGCNQQVMLKCRIVEFDLAQMRQLGVDMSLFHGEDVETAGVIPGGVRDSALMDRFIEAMRVNGMAKILAEPVIVTTNRRPASLRSGGEFPIVVPNGRDEVSIEYRNFGISIEAVPIVLGNGRLRLDIAPEVSERDFSNAVDVNGFVVPGLTTRRVNTQVELQFGETVTLVMGSPTAPQTIQQTGGETGPSAPETVTVICVTPEAVHPMRED